MTTPSLLAPLLTIVANLLPLDATLAVESWPILGAFLLLQTTITAPILGFVIKQNLDLRGQIEKRVTDKDVQLVAKDKEIERLNARCDQFMEMAFAAVQGFDQSTVVAQDATNVAKIVTGRRAR